MSSFITAAVLQLSDPQNTTPMSQVLIICKCTLLYNRLASLILILVTISVQNQQSHSVDMEDNQPPPSWNIYWEGLRNKKLKSELLLPNPSWSTMTPTTFLCSSRTHNAVLQALIPYQKGNAGYQLFGEKKSHTLLDKTPELPCKCWHLNRLLSGISISTQSQTTGEQSMQFVLHIITQLSLLIL